MTKLESQAPPKRVLVVSYSQMGTLDEIVTSFLTPFRDSAVDIVHETIRPLTPFPFPWSVYHFLNVFPESFREIRCPLESCKVEPDDNFNLVIIAYPVWYLSPSLPVSSFLQGHLAAGILRGRRVLTIVGARNLWYRAHEKIKGHLRASGADLIGHIALTDRTLNLVSLITIVYWMLTGKKGRLLGLFPRPGIAPEDIAGCAAYGRIVLESLSAPAGADLQNRLDQAGACRIVPHLMALERAGSRAFRIWSSLILRANKRLRPLLVGIFGFHLACGITLMSPLSFLVFHLALPFRRGAIRRQIENVRRY